MHEVQVNLPATVLTELFESQESPERGIIPVSILLQNVVLDIKKNADGEYTLSEIALLL